MTDRERLVELLNNHCAVGYEGNECTNPFTDDCGECLADYLLADGWMRPPCKVGKTVYQIILCKDKTGSIVECKVVGFHMGDFPEIRGHKRSQYLIVHHDATNSITHIDIKQIGKTVFLSREEAEKALRGGDEK